LGLQSRAEERQPIIAEEHRAAHEHRRAAEAAARDQLVSVAAQPRLTGVGLDTAKKRCCSNPAWFAMSPARLPWQIAIVAQ